jgi:hypothetical protein
MLKLLGLLLTYQPHYITVRILFIQQPVLIMWQGTPAVIAAYTPLFQIYIKEDIVARFYVCRMLLFFRKPRIKIFSRVVDGTEANWLEPFYQ